MGSTRDIPLDSKIHPTVHQLHRSGILSDKQLPTIGGEEEQPPMMTRFLNFFRRRRVSTGLGDEDYEEINTGNESEDSDVTAVQTDWETRGQYFAKTWSWEDN
jgi:hypothetical protein